MPTDGTNASQVMIPLCTSDFGVKQNVTVARSLHTRVVKG